MDATGSLDIGQGLSIEGGVACQEGGKYTQPQSNNDRDLAEVAPLKAKLGVVYDKDGLFSTIEWVHSNAFKRIDGDAGEVPIKAWDVMNFRASYNVGHAAKKCPILKGMNLHFGIDNIFDAKYAVANSYEFDPTDPTGRNVRIVNEPGRFVYGSLSYSF
jgi:iron complex outermembrane receptor protein